VGSGPLSIRHPILDHSFEAISQKRRETSVFSIFILPAMHCDVTTVVESTADRQCGVSVLIGAAEEGEMKGGMRTRRDRHTLQVAYKYKYKYIRKYGT
jgi:hypothetical protein